MKIGREVLERVERTVKDVPKDDIEFRYLEWIRDTDKVNYLITKEIEYLADKIISKMKNHKMNFTESCIVIGYVRKLLRIGEEYISGIDVESVYIKYCLSDELIELSKNIADYIENQEEVYANIPATLNNVYRKVKAKTKEVILW
ncbi:hypothetical protein QJR26_06950 [Clostridium baratii]